MASLPLQTPSFTWEMDVCHMFRISAILGTMLNQVVLILIGVANRIDEKISNNVIGVIKFFLITDIIINVRWCTS